MRVLSDFCIWGSFTFPYLYSRGVNVTDRQIHPIGIVGVMFIRLLTA